MKVGLSAPSHPAKHLCALSRVDLHPRAHVCSQHWSEKVALWVMDPDARRDAEPRDDGPRAHSSPSTRTCPGRQLARGDAPRVAFFSLF